MSLSRNQEETNYWPSISDMFLVFFVLAIALTSSMISGQSAGEKFIIDDVADAATELVNYVNGHLEPKTPIATPPQRVGEGEYGEVNTAALSERLDEAWKLIAEKIPARPLSDSAQHEFDELRERSGKADYRRSIRLMYYHLGMDAAAADRHYDKMLRLVNAELRRLVEEKTPPPPAPPTAGERLAAIQKALGAAGMTDAQLQERLEAIRTALAETSLVLEELPRIIRENPKLATRIRELEQLVDKLRDKLSDTSQTKEVLRQLRKSIEQMRAELEQKDKRVRELEAKEGSLTAELKKLKQQMDKLSGEHGRYQISQIVMSEHDVSFDLNRTAPRIGSTGRYDMLLDFLSARLKEAGSCRLVVEVIGHTDSARKQNATQSESDDYNAGLGLKRAMAFIQKIKKDLAPRVGDDAMERLQFQPYSASYTRPVLTQDGKEDSGTSRRVEVLVRPEATERQ